MKNRIRLGKPDDYKKIVEWDEFWGDRRQEIQRCELFVSCNETNEIEGFLVLSRNDFFSHPLISFLCVKSQSRRQKVATGLLEFISKRLEGTKHFTTTEKKNHQARKLFESLNYKVSGELLYLDDEPEIVYVKF